MNENLDFPTARNEFEYDVLTNEKIVAGSFDQDQFNDWFGTNIVATTTEILKVEQYELTAVWDEFGQIVGLNANYD